MRPDKIVLRVLLLAFIVQVAPFGIPSLSQIWKLIKFGKQVGEKIKEGYDLYQEITDDTSERIDKILTNVKEIAHTVDGMEARLDRKIDSMIDTLVTRITLAHKLDATFLELHKMITRVDDIYKHFIEYASQDRSSSAFNNRTIKAFVDTATGEDAGGLQDLLNEIHGLVVPYRTAHFRDSLFLIMLKDQRETRQIVCDEGLSPHEAIYQIYSTLALTELRGFIVAAYAYGLLPIFSPGSYVAEVNRIEARFALRAQEYLRASKEAMSIASKSIRRCDPVGGHIANKTYVQFNGITQTYVVSEPDISDGNKCTGTCETMGETTLRQRIDTEHCNYQKPCFGIVTNCYKGGGDMQLCELGYNSTRRYQWFKDSEGTTYGKGGSCAGNMLYPSGWSRGLVRCDYCICDCLDEKFSPFSFYAISLMNQTSEVDWNRVVTGARLVREANMLHIQLKQGTLGPQGSIDPDSESWMPLPKIKYVRDTRDKNGGRFIIMYQDRTQELLKEGVHYTLIKRNSRRINLDDVVLNHGWVTSGARFRRNERLPNNPVELQVQGILYDFSTGKLETDVDLDRQWFDFEETKPYYEHYKTPRYRLKFNRPDDPLKNAMNLATVSPYLFLEFQHTDNKKDAGQNVIPFWDIQEIYTIPRFPLQGIGLYFKGSNDGTSGGFLGLRLHTLDFTDHLNTTIPEYEQHEFEQYYTEPLYTPQLPGTF